MEVRASSHPCCFFVVRLQCQGRAVRFVFAIRWWTQGAAVLGKATSEVASTAEAQSYELRL